MSDFFQTLFTFPASFLSVLMLGFLLYWLLVLFGMLDVDSIGDFNLAFLSHFASIAGGPISILLTLWIFSAWLILVPFTYFILIPLPDTLRSILGLAALVFVIWVGFWATHWLIKPLHPLFRETKARSGHALLGKLCVVNTSKANAEFGQGLYDDKGAGLILQIRTQGESVLKQGEKALLVDYDSVRGVYLVAPHWDKD